MISWHAWLGFKGRVVDIFTTVDKGSCLAWEQWIDMNGYIGGCIQLTTL